MKPKSIQDRLDSLNESLIIYKINSTLDELISKSEEPPHVCQGDQCENNILSKCRGNEASACNGNCGGHHHAKEYGNEVHTKALPVNKVTCNDGTVIEGFFLVNH